MNRVVVSKRADEDMLEIWLYVATDNLIAADALLADFEAKFMLFAGAPEIGHPRVDLPIDVRCFPVGNYLIFYRLALREIFVIRVLHGARRLPSLL